MYVKGYDGAQSSVNASSTFAVLGEKHYPKSIAQTWLRSPSDDHGWFMLTNMKSGNVLVAESINGEIRTKFEG